MWRSLFWLGKASGSAGDPTAKLINIIEGGRDMSVIGGVCVSWQDICSVVLVGEGSAIDHVYECINSASFDTFSIGVRSELSTLKNPAELKMSYVDGSDESGTCIYKAICDLLEDRDGLHINLELP